MKGGDWRVNRSFSQTPIGRKANYYKVKQKIFDALGNKCSRCGYSDPRALQIDHINSDGVRDRQKKGVAYYYLILSRLTTGNYQLLCANCNWIKRHEAGEVKQHYPDDFVFPREELHKPVYKEKSCVICASSYIPTNGRQLRCTYCVKG